MTCVRRMARAVGQHARFFGSCHMASAIRSRGVILTRRLSPRRPCWRRSGRTPSRNQEPGSPGSGGATSTGQSVPPDWRCPACRVARITDGSTDDPSQRMTGSRPVQERYRLRWLPRSFHRSPKDQTQTGTPYRRNSMNGVRAAVDIHRPQPRRSGAGRSV